MTTNYHTPIPSTSPANAEVWNNRLSDLDGAITGLAAGTTSLTNLNVGTDTTLTISGGVVTRTRTRHIIDTESSAATDDLTTVNGGAEGDILIISSVSASRVVTLKHGTGNLYFTGKIDFVLDDTDKSVMLYYTGARWEQLNGQPTRGLSYNSLRVIDGPAVAAPLWARNRFDVRGGGSTGTLVASGISTPVTSGTASASNDTDSSYSNLASGNVSGNAAGVSPNGGTYNNFRYQHNPLYSLVMRTVDITAVRMWFGMSSAAFGNGDTAGGECAGFRFSTVAGDTGFVAVTKDSSTQTTGSPMNTIAASTRYLLQVQLDYTNSRAVFTINNGTPTYVTTTLPSATTELSFSAIIYTQAGAIKNFKLSRLVVEYD